MGKKNAQRYLPFVGSLAFFIFFNNALALIPGFAPPTDTLKTNVALALLVFLATHFLGVREHGISYFKHFFGPILVLSPLMFLIEVISHIARPVSLSLRLMGNMAADHKVVAIFFGLVPILVPVPFLILGILVVVIQTLVFTLLSMVYISMAVAHEEHH
jgi:F-type H+-transporting ATPase subunit a